MSPCKHRILTQGRLCSGSNKPSCKTRTAFPHHQTQSTYPQYNKPNISIDQADRFVAPAAAVVGMDADAPHPPKQVRMSLSSLSLPLGPYKTTAPLFGTTVGCTKSTAESLLLLCAGFVFYEGCCCLGLCCSVCRCCFCSVCCASLCFSCPWSLSSPFCCFFVWCACCIIPCALGVAGLAPHHMTAKPQGGAGRSHGRRHGGRRCSPSAPAATGSVFVCVSVVGVCFDGLRSRTAQPAVHTRNTKNYIPIHQAALPEAMPDAVAGVDADAPHQLQQVPMLWSSSSASVSVSVSV